MPTRTRKDIPSSRARSTPNKVAWPFPVCRVRASHGICRRHHPQHSFVHHQMQVYEVARKEGGRGNAREGKGKVSYTESFDIGPQGLIRET